MKFIEVHASVGKKKSMADDCRNCEKKKQKFIRWKKKTDVESFNFFVLYASVKKKNECSRWLRKN